MNLPPPFFRKAALYAAIMPVELSARQRAADASWPNVRFPYGFPGRACPETGHTMVFSPMKRKGHHHVFADLQ